MLAQHLVTRPIFEALFEVYNFGANNPVAQTMERMLAVLDEHALDAENETLQSFYASVRRRVAGVDNAEGKQKILVDLYDEFFATAFKKTVDKLGIVYTPVEIVDFILRSADQVLRAEFGQGLTDEGVHILDGFTGTGTFLVRLMQSGLIEPHDLARKYAQELHGNEILLLAYYIAAVNIETTYQDLTGTAEPFPGLILTDTFQSWEDGDRLDYEVFRDNNARLERLKALPIRALVGNPPYSSGQDSANDDNANESYPTLDEAIRRTYAERSGATNKNSLYDSYIRAIKGAAMRVTDRGVIACVTNGGWLDSNTGDGMRKTLADEFSAIYIYNLRGNQRTAGEQSRKEGGKIFGGGSRATVAITLPVKDDSKPGTATVHYADIGDYLSRDEKLAKIATEGAAQGVDFTSIKPNPQGDWLNQRSGDFDAFMPVVSIFTSVTAGVKSNRDAWVYNFSRPSLTANVERLLDAYSESVGKVASHADFSLIAARDTPDLHLLDSGQFLARWRYELIDDSGTLDLGSDDDVIDGYRKVDNITDAALIRFQATYPGTAVTKDDIFRYVYGLLHSPEYPETYAADLKKMLPRIPFVEDFRGYADAGRALSELHLGYESVPSYPLAGLDAAPPSGADPYDFFRVQKMRFPKKGERGAVVYNDHITVSDIPDGAYRYMLGSRSAVEWVIDRYQVKTDTASGIVNDPNDWSLEVGDPRYILDLLARVVTVSLETMKIVDALPPFAIRPV